MFGQTLAENIEEFANVCWAFYGGPRNDPPESENVQ